MLNLFLGFSYVGADAFFFDLLYLYFDVMSVLLLVLVSAFFIVELIVSSRRKKGRPWGVFLRFVYRFGSEVSLDLVFLLIPSLLVLYFLIPSISSILGFSLFGEYSYDLFMFLDGPDWFLNSASDPTISIVGYPRVGDGSLHMDMLCSPNESAGRKKIDIDPLVDLNVVFLRHCSCKLFSYISFASRDLPEDVQRYLLDEFAPFLVGYLTLGKLEAVSVQTLCWGEEINFVPDLTVDEINFLRLKKSFFPDLINKISRLDDLESLKCSVKFVNRIVGYFFRGESRLYEYRADCLKDVIRSRSGLFGVKRLFMSPEERVELSRLKDYLVVLRSHADFYSKCSAWFFQLNNK